MERLLTKVVYALLDKKIDCADFIRRYFFGTSLNCLVSIQIFYGFVIFKVTDWLTTFKKL